MQTPYLGWRALALTLITGACVSSAAYANGIILPGAGPIHRSMAGASTAAAEDALGGLYWNPATISSLPRPQVDFGLEVGFIDHEVAASIGGLTGASSAEAGTVPAPHVGWVYRPHADSPVTYGLGINTIGGLKTNLQSSTTNPVLAPQPFGLGRVSSEATFMQIAPVVSYRLGERTSFAMGPLLSMGQIELEPFVFAPPNADGRYSPGRASRYHWGAGAQCGVYYVHSPCWQFGASLKSPIIFEDFRFFGEDAFGGPRTLEADIDLPAIVSVGLAYRPTNTGVLALDARFLDYAHADGFGDRGQFRPDGSLAGLDYSSILAVAVGVRQQLTDWTAVSCGYLYNQNPVRNSESFLNIASPLIYQHTVSAGVSLALSPHSELNLAYMFWPEVTREGPVILPGIGAVPGSRFTNQVGVHSIAFGISTKL